MQTPGPLWKDTADTWKDTADTKLLGEPKHTSLLHQTLDEEKKADTKLTETSNEIDIAAITAHSE